MKGKEGTWLIAVEQFLKGFSRNVFGLFTLAQVVSEYQFLIEQINSLVCYDCMNIFGMVPITVHPNQVRAHFNIKNGKVAAKKGKGKSEEDEEPEGKKSDDVKKQVWMQMSKKVKSDFSWPIVKRRSEDLPLIERLDSVSFDISDALAIATYAWQSSMEKKVLNFQQKKVGAKA